MTTKSKIRVIPTLFVVAAVLFGAWMVFPTAIEEIMDNQDKVVLDVAFKPEQRTGQPPGDGRIFPDTVSVELIVGGVGSKFPLTKPWHSEIPAVKGQKIKLSASQVYGAEISVRIYRAGFQAAFQSGFGPTEVSVVFTVR